MGFDEFNPTPDQDLADYLDDNYGTCKLPKCVCLRRIVDGLDSWKGTLCDNWVPTGARNWDELGLIWRKASFS